MEATESPMNECIVATVRSEPEWTSELRKDEIYGRIIDDLENNRLSESVLLPGHSKKLKIADFAMIEGYLALLENHHIRRVVPQSHRKSLFLDAHAGMLAGHFGPKKILRSLSQRVFWETMRSDVIKWCEECKTCILHNNKQTITPPLKPITTSKPYEIIGIDILEMGPTTEGNRYILSVVDHFTKYGGAYPIPTKAAETVSRVLFERWISDGCRLPKCILSDQGTEFENKLMTELTRLMGIKQIFTKGYNPRENGLTERFNRTIIGLLRKKVNIPVEWDKL
ncbi:hypothetical protein Aduo_000473 [Ancylostoma duodenale]